MPCWLSSSRSRRMVSVETPNSPASAEMRIAGEARSSPRIRAWRSPFFSFFRPATTLGPPRGEQRLGQLNEAGGSPGAGHPMRLVGEALGEIEDIGNPYRLGEMAKHRPVIGRIPDEDDAHPIGIGIDIEGLGKQAPGHGELVIGAVPAID